MAPRRYVLQSSNVFFPMTCLNNIYDSVMKYLCIYHGVTELNPKSAHLLETKHLGGPPSGKVQFPFCLVNALIWSRLCLNAPSITRCLQLCAFFPFK